MYRKNSNSREYLAETFLAGSATTFTVAAPRVDPPFPTFSRKRLRYTANQTSDPSLRNSDLELRVDGNMEGI
jgi:hypothetical protein